MRKLLFIHLLLLTGLVGAQTPNDQPDATTPSQLSRVVWIERPSVVNKFTVNSDEVGKMFIQALQTYTGQKNLGLAWKQLGILPSDTVGIKINAAMGTVMSTRRALVDIVVESLGAAGVPPNRIIIWDKFGSDLENTGWLPQPDGVYPLVRSVIPGAGFDPKQYYVNEVMGSLIWGDFLFRGKKPTKEDLLRMAEKEAQKALPDPDNNVNSVEAKKIKLDEQDQTSNRSYLTTIVTQSVTKIINIPVMADHDDWGLSGCLSSLAIGSVDNTRRFANEDYDGDPAIPEILSRDVFRNKVILHIMDGLIAQYAGGPQFVPLYTQSLGALYLSRDPVAIDSLVEPRMEQWRLTAHTVPSADATKHIKTAAQMGLGQMDPKMIELIRLN